MEDELRYQQKCTDLKRRIEQVEKHNEGLVLKTERLKHALKRIRIERAVLQHELQERTTTNVDDSDGSPSPPASPIDHELLKFRLEEAQNEEKAAKGAKQKKQKPGTANGKSVNSGDKIGNDTRFEKFAAHNRTSIELKFKEDHPGETFDESKELVRAWEALDDTQRSIYDDDEDELVDIKPESSTQHKDDDDVDMINDED